MAVNPQKILYCKNNSKENFQAVQIRMVLGSYFRYTFKTNRNNTENNKPQQKQVK